MPQPCTQGESWAGVGGYWGKRRGTGTSVTWQGLPESVGNTLADFTTQTSDRFGVCGGLVSQPPQRLGLTCRQSLASAWHWQASGLGLSPPLGDGPVTKPALSC